eukprot:CAMPEP_0195507294 /NCGR_PEP_ID=MMETSP0794_2-20130614/763_1 /TAXON_ID=515487 /ORGANISM="Stephanopyxis turris, Strain CCMP 815" /LENGTH=528 /DNA_ID=CAMNT_0040633927 /DNA_START=47 /DNA_END=1633 /DNA_ORIENTATION=+
MTTPNFRDQDIGDDWTVPSTASKSTFDTESYVNMGHEVPALQLSAMPRNESIGAFSNQSTTQVCVNIKACELLNEDDDKRMPVDIVVALDISSSMAGEKLNDCKRTLELMLRNLTSKDRLGLISYGSQAKVEIPACFVTEENKANALQKIKSLAGRGSTNLSGGLSLAMHEMNIIDKPNAVRSIFLLTDGMANTGIISTEGLISMVQNFNENQAPSEEMNDMRLQEPSDTASVDTKPKTITVNSMSPVSLFSFGYGSHHNSDMLRAVSDVSPGGAYYFVQNDSDVSSAFGDAMGGLLSVVAQSAVVTISVPLNAVSNGVKILNVYHKDQIKRDNGSFTINVGDFYAEETRDVLFELRLSNAPSETAVPHVSVTLSYMDVIHKKAAASVPVECSIGRPPNGELSPTDMHVESQWLRVRVIQEMEAADREARGNNLEAASKRMQRNIDFILASPANQQPMVMALKTDAQDVIRGFKSASQYRSMGTHTMQSKSTQLRRQRCMESSASTRNFYRSSKKAAYTSHFQKKEEK